MNREKIGGCPEKDLTLYYYGELDSSRSREIREHVEGCPACHNALEEMKSLLAALPKQDMEWSPLERQRFSGRVMDKVNARRHRRFAPLFGGGLATAAVALAFLALHTGPIPQPIPAAGSSKMVADLEILQDMDMLQHLEIIKDLDLLQDLGDIDERV